MSKSKIQDINNEKTENITNILLNFINCINGVYDIVLNFNKVYNTINLLLITLTAVNRHSRVTGVAHMRRS